MNSLDDLLPDVATVIRCLAKEMRGRAVEPNFVHEAFVRMGEPLSGHTVVIHHMPQSRKGVRPKRVPHYVMTIAGKRTDGRWSFRPGQLSKLLKLAES